MSAAAVLNGARMCGAVHPGFARKQAPAIPRKPGLSFPRRIKLHLEVINAALRDCVHYNK